MDFPRLKTGAVAQYPARREVTFGTRALTFLDGSEQRYREAKELKQWIIRLNLLDDQEAAEIESFFAAQQGRKENFAFTDPWDGVAYPSCSLANDELEMNWRGEGRCATVLTVIENRD